MSPRFVLGRENVPCVAEVVNRSLKADCTDFTLSRTFCLEGPRGELVDFYDGGDHVRPFSQTPKYVDQIFQRPQIC